MEKEKIKEKENMLKILRQHKAELRNLGVKRIAIFGSFARGEQTKDSDIDIYVEFEIPSYQNLLNLEKFLKKILNRKVDIVTQQGLESIRIKEIQQKIRQTLEYV